MEKEKFKMAETTLYDLLKSKKAFEEVDIKNRDYYFIECLDREIINAARELLAAAGEEIDEDKLPFSPEDRFIPSPDYVSNIKSNSDGTIDVFYNGGAAGKRLKIYPPQFFKTEGVPSK